MKSINAKFITSSSKLEQCPTTGLPEYAFIGRSNVGKSSLINMLTGNSSLAKVSATPGKTQLINHFIVNDSWYIVDLPGYGYAKVSKSVKQDFQRIITDYIFKREQLINLFVLVDSRHEPQRIDMEFMQQLGEKGIPFAIIFTKTDKLKPIEIKQNIDRYKQRMLEDWEDMPQYFVTSSEKNVGREEIINYIDEINQNLE